MIRDPKTDLSKINVYLKSGTQFTNKDVTSLPLGEGESFGRCVSFWHFTKLVVIPMDLVKMIELIPEKEKE